MAHGYLWKNKHIATKPERSDKYKIYKFIKIERWEIYKMIYRNIYFKEWNHVIIVFEKNAEFNDL